MMWYFSAPPLLRDGQSALLFTVGFIVLVGVAICFFTKRNR
ncbi:cell wall-associated protein [Streptomyces prasinus]|uniref:Cell wall-associated protein n=1 Tax=Streptomyces prasinus TaxID=67345 RepID=A0ABX6B5H0_9ACTN|nr:cell wall-associated protein [Streptomyces prasinus]